MFDITAATNIMKEGRVQVNILIVSLQTMPERDRLLSYV